MAICPILDRRARAVGGPARRLAAELDSVQPLPPGPLDPALDRAKADAEPTRHVPHRLAPAGQRDHLPADGVSLHGGLVCSWPRGGVTAKNVMDALLEHWRAFGLPAYAQFDNDPIFAGAHARPDTFGRVIRLCLSLGGGARLHAAAGDGLPGGGGELQRPVAGQGGR